MVERSAPTIQADGVTLELSGNVMSVKDSGITPAKLSFSPLKLKASAITTSATTTVTFSELDLNTDKVYVLWAQVEYNALNNWLRLFINNDTTTTNYYTQLIWANSTSITGQISNDTLIGYTDTTACCLECILMKGEGSSKPKFQGRFNRNTGTEMVLYQFVGSYETAVSNVTQIDISHISANGIGANSKFYLLSL